MRRCHECATTFVARLPGADAGEDYAAYYNANNLDVPAFINLRLDELVGSFARHRKTGRWLDVGCGAGSLLRAAARAGWQAEGTELAPQPVAMLRSEGFSVHLGEIPAVSLPSRVYDVVSMIEVLEHLPDPRETLQHVLTLLRPGGALLITTPHGRGISARLLKLRWSVVSPPEHLQLFSIAGLNAVLTATGFRDIVVRSRGVNPLELVHAARHSHRGSPAMTGDDRVRAAYHLNASLERSRTGAVAKATANKLLELSSAGDSLTCTALSPSARS